jgi:hypothetical protein
MASASIKLKKGTILSDNLNHTLMAIAINVRKDVDGFALAMTTVFLVMTGLLVYWITLGYYGMQSYARDWVAANPSITVDQTATWNYWFTVIYTLTPWLLCLFFAYINTVLICLAYTSEPVHIQKDTPNKQVKKPVKKLKHDVCPYCDSRKVREAGACSTHAGRMFCKSCKEFY